MLNFPDSPTLGEVFLNWEWDGHKWINKGHLRSPEEAPHDGVTYGRKDETWQPVLNLEDGGTVEKDLTVEGHFITHGRAEIGTTVAAGQVGLEVARDSIFHGKTTVRTPLTGVEAANKDYVDQEIAGRKYASTITGNGSDREFDIKHDLDSRDVLVGIYDQDHKLVLADVESTDPDEVMISFANPPATGRSYHVVVMG